MDFDPDDESSWDFGSIGRQATNDLLMKETESGVFLVRASGTRIGDLVLCVREENRVAHYIINRIDSGSRQVYRIGDKDFDSMSELLKFYKLHYLDSTALIRPAQHRLGTVKALYNFKGHDAEDLPFQKDEILTIIRKDEEQWWTACNAAGQIGAIPVPYVKICKESEESLLNAPISNISPAALPTSSHSATSNGSDSTRPNPDSSNDIHNSSHNSDSLSKTKNENRSLPAKARAIRCYSKLCEPLSFDVGDIILVTKIHLDGRCEGELQDANASSKIRGVFPSTYIEWLDEDENAEQVISPNNDQNVSK